MKKMLMVCAAFAALVVGAAENPYASYEKAMAPVKDSPMAVEWQNKDDAAIAQATTPAALAAYVKDAAAAKALLAKVKGAYATCPMDLTVIAAVSQFVMKPACAGACPKACADQRKVWNGALLDVAQTSADDYVKTFMLDQLRWCGCPSQAAAVRALGDKSAKSVKDFAYWVAAELDAAKTR